MFYFDEFLGKKVLKSDKLKDVFHFFTTREFILKTKDANKIDLMLKNRADIKSELNLDVLISPSQRHTSNIALFDINKEKYEDTDALIIKDKKAGIFLNFADCTPIILFDKVSKIASVVHAGWRGTVQKIAPKAVLKMIELFDSKPENIIAAIGPCICFECFETSFEIAQKLLGTIQDGDNFIKKKKDSFFADLKQINAAQLFDAGLVEIDVCPYCTYHNNDLFFSYRKENKTTDRISAVVALI